MCVHKIRNINVKYYSTLLHCECERVVPGPNELCHFLSSGDVRGTLKADAKRPEKKRK